MGFVCSVCGNSVAGSPLINKPVPATDNAHKKCKDAKVVNGTASKVQKSALVAQGSAKAADRKALTGRERQGNHDSNTKPSVRGGAKGDRHDNGIRQAGRAADKK